MGSGGARVVGKRRLGSVDGGGDRRPQFRPRRWRPAAAGPVHFGFGTRGSGQECVFGSDLVRVRVNGPGFVRVSSDLVNPRSNGSDPGNSLTDQISSSVKHESTPVKL